MSTADGISCNQGNDRLGHASDDALQLKHIQTWNTTVADVSGMSTHFLVPAGTERILPVCSRPLARKQHNTYARVVPNIPEGVDHFVDGSRTKRIAYLRTVKGDAGDAVRFLVRNVGVLFNSAPIHGTSDVFE